MFRQFLARTFSPHARRRLAHRRLGVLRLEDRTAPAAGLFADLNAAGLSSAASYTSTFYATAAVGGRAIYPVTTGVGSTRLWQSDGTAAGTAELQAGGQPLYATWTNQPFAALGGFLYFFANTTAGGNPRQLYKTDGTSAPTLVADLSVTAAGRTQTVSNLDTTAPRGLWEAGGRLYFSALTSDGATSYGAELWTSDGTATGTRFVGDLLSGTAGSTPSAFTPVATDLVAFTARTSSANGQEVWSYRPSTPATPPVKLTSVSTGSFTAVVTGTGLVAAGGRMYFAVQPSAGATVQLYSSDGTVGGTLGLPTSTINSPNALVAQGSKVLLVAKTAATGTAFVLCASDGSAANTAAVTAAAGGSVNVTNWLTGTFAQLGGITYFNGSSATSNYELWKSDGTTAGTVQVLDIYPGSGSSQVNFMGTAGGKLAFTATNPTYGKELWTTDGTTAGTTLVADLTAGSTDTFFDQTGALPTAAALGTKLVFSAGNSTTGDVEPWVTDGTAAGTTRLADITPGTTGSYLSRLVSAGSQAFFFANDNGLAGVELWRTDGTAAGTLLPKDPRPATNSSLPTGLAVMGGYVYATGTTANNKMGLFRSKAGGPVELVKDLTAAFGISPTFANRPMPVFNNRVYFQAPATGKLYVSDGTAAGTVAFATAGMTGYAPLGVVGAAFYFVGGTTATGQELWRTTTGLAADAVLVTDINSGSGSSSIADPQTAGGRLFFDATDGSSTQVYAVAETGGAVKLTSSGTATLAQYGQPVALPGGGWLLGVTDGQGIGYPRLYRTDGTAAGTASITPASLQFLDARLYLFNGTAYFAGYSSGFGRELWLTTGVTAETLRVTDLGQGVDDGVSYVLGTAGGKLVFGGRASSGGVSAAGYELYSFDGTEGGTALLADLTPGSGDTSLSYYNKPFQVGTSLYIAGSTAATGYEAVRTDGTAGGTVLVDDLSAGPTDGVPTNNDYGTWGVDFGGSAVFFGTSALYGTELFTDTPPVVPVAQFGTTSGSVVEAATTYTVTVTLSGAAASAVSIPYTLSGTATGGSDYTVPAGPLVIPAGQTSGTITVTVLDDSAPEATETVVLTLGTPTNATLGSKTAHTLTITDNDVPAASFSANAAVEEWGGTVPVTVTLDYPSTTALTLTVQTAGTATSGSDYTLSATTLTIPAGQTTATFNVSVVSDADDAEGDETAALSLTGSGFTPPAAPYTLTIRQRPTVSLSVVGGSSVAEAGGTTTVRATLSRVMADPVSVGVSAGGTAAAGDYTLSPTGFSIPAGQLSADLTFTAVQDATDEADEVATLAPVVGTGTGPRPRAGTAASVTITDDDGPTVRFGSANQSVNEYGSPAVTVSVQLSAASPQAVTVPLTYGGTATAGTDYTAGPASVTVPAGQTSVGFSFNLIDDTADEPAETIAIGFGAIVNGVAGSPATHTVTIAAGEPTALSWTTAPATRSENPGGSHTFNAFLSRPLSTALTVPVTYGGTATKGLDYTASVTEVTFPAGVQSAAVTIVIRDDTAVEDTERVTVILPAVNTADVQSAATSTYLDITSDDVAPTAAMVSVAQTVSEGGWASIAFQLSAPTNVPVTLPFTLSGTAGYGAAADYTFTPQAGLSGSGSSWQVVLPAGTVLYVVTANPVNDTAFEPTEQFTVTLGTPTNTGLDTTRRTHTVTILDDDQPLVRLATFAADVDEGGTSTLTAQLYTLNAAGQRVMYPAPSGGVSVPFTVSGTATRNSDYTLPASNTVVIPAGQSSGTVTLTAIRDNVAEPGASETVTVTLAPTGSLTAGDNVRHTFTIKDKDALAVTFGLPSPDTFRENGNTTTLTARLAAAATVPVTLTLTDVTGGTATNLLLRATRATAADFRVNGSLNTYPTVIIPAGQLEGTFTVQAVDDSEVEGGEWLKLRVVATASGGELANKLYELTVGDDDTYAEFTGGSPGLVEGDPATNFGVRLSSARPVSTSVPVTLNAAIATRDDFAFVANGSAVPASTSTFFVSVPAGQTSASFTVRAVQDNVNENLPLPLPQIATLTIGSSVGVAPRPGGLAAYPLQVFERPTVSWSAKGSSGNKGVGSYTVTANLSSSAPAGGLTVPYTYAYSGGIRYGTDVTDTIPYAGLYFAAGTSTVSYTVTVKNNPYRRTAGSYTITLGKPAANVGLGGYPAFTFSVAASASPPPPPAPRPPATAAPPPVVLNPATAGTLGVSTSGEVDPIMAAYNPNLAPQGAAADYFPGGLPAQGIGTLAVSLRLNGFVAGATVFLDLNGNFRQDEWVDLNGNGVQEPDEFEPGTTTRYDGSFILSYPAAADHNGDGLITLSEAQLVLVGGTDLSTNRPVPVPLAATPGSVVVTPLTTLLTRLMATGLTHDQANARLVAALNLPDVAVAAVDHGNGSRNGDLGSFRLKQASTALNSLVTQVANLLHGLPGGPPVAGAAVYVLDDLADKLLAAGSTFDFQSAPQVASLLDGAAGRLGLTLPADLRDAAAEVSAAAAGVLAAVPETTGGDAYLIATARVQRVGQADIPDAFAAAAAGTRTPASLVADFTGGSLTTAVANAAIGDVLPPTLSVGSVNVAEGNSGTRTLRFTVTLDRPTQQAGGVRVRYHTQDNTATGGEDYQSLGGSELTWAPGESGDRFVDVQVSGDTLPEFNELFAFVLSEPTNAVISADVGWGLIRADDALQYVVPDDGATSNNLLLTVNDNVLVLTRNEVPVWEGILSDGVPVSIVGRDDTDDNLVLDLHGTNLLAQGIAFEAGGGTDSFTVLGGQVRDSSFTPQGAGAGRYDYAGGGFVRYTGVEVGVAAQPPRVVENGVQVNGGTAQRSVLTTVGVTFDQVVTVAAGAFTLTRQSDPATISSAAGGQVVVSTAVVNGQTVATLTFQTASGSSLVEGRGALPASLADGVWVLTVAADKVTTADGMTLATDFLTPATGTKRVVRFFGDGDGDGRVSGPDYTAFRTGYNRATGQTGYRAELDFNGDGLIGAADNTEFMKRYGKTI